MSNYVQITDKSDPPKTIFWKPWTYLTSLIKEIEEYDDIVILKARQLGVTWVICAYALWKALFSDGARVLLFSQAEGEAEDLIAKVRFIWAHLPGWLKLSLEKERLDKLKFAVNGSELVAYPSTGRAGRSTDATLVIRDELEKHDKAEEHYASVKPTIDAGGKMIDLSTIDKQVADSHFQDRVNRILSGGSKAHLIFRGWRERPERIKGMSLDEWFDLKVRGEYPDWQIENEYPATLEEALAPSATIGFFSKKALDAMRHNILPPIETRHSEMVKIFKNPIVGSKYCVFSDPSDGGEDPHHIVVMDTVTGEEVALSHGKTTADVCAMIHDELSREYKAFNGNELNAYAGGKFDETINNLQTPNRCPFISPDGVPKLNKDGIAVKFGWWTSPQLKRKMLFGLEEAIRQRQITVHDTETIEEFRNFIRTDDGKFQAKRGWHDDRVMAWSGVWELQKHKPSIGIVRSVRPKTFMSGRATVVGGRR
uniref:Putative terminase n=1 Tax=viral metagenome TaxID=1070528 RepID=A0A6H1ZEY3_9ZZZZ